LLDDFVNGHLPKHPDAWQLVKLKEGSRRLLHFKDFYRVVEIYSDFKNKDKNENTKSSKEPTKMKDNFKNSMAQFEKPGYLKKVGFGTKFDKQFLTYEIKHDELWSLLKRNYSVPRSSHMVIQTFIIKVFNLHLYMRFPLTFINSQFHSTSSRGSLVPAKMARQD
jgi:hypothetical protein